MKTALTKTAIANPLILSRYARIQRLPFATLGDKRRTCLQWLKENMAGKEIRNAGYEIKLSWQGLKNDVSHHHGNNVSKLHSFTAIDRIITNAKLLGVEPDRTGNARVQWVKLYSKVKIKRSLFDVFIYLKQTDNGTAIYDHVLFLQ